MKRQDRYLIAIVIILGGLFPLWQNMSPIDTAMELHAPEKPENYKDKVGVAEYLPERVRGQSLRSVGESIVEHNFSEVKHNIEDHLERYIEGWGLNLVQKNEEAFTEQNASGTRSPASIGALAIATPSAKVARGKVGLQVMNAESVRVRYRNDGPFDLTCEVKKDKTELQMKWSW